MTVIETVPAAAEETVLRQDYETLGGRLARRGVDIEAVKRKAAGFGVAVPSWGVGTGGTRFARFPGAGEPRGIFDKLEDCAVIHRLTGATPTVSLHVPWDKAEPAALRDKAAELGLGFDAMNSNTFQDSPGQRLSYKFGSLSHTDAAVRAQAVEHNLECIALGAAIGSKARARCDWPGKFEPSPIHTVSAFEPIAAPTAMHSRLCSTACARTAASVWLSEPNL